MHIVFGIYGGQEEQPPEAIYVTDIALSVPTVNSVTLSLPSVSSVTLSLPTVSDVTLE
jgi:hypothetical protein